MKLIEVMPVQFSKPVLPEDSKSETLEERVLSEIKNNDIVLQNGDIVVVTSKVVSLLEGNFLRLSEIKVRKRIKILARLFSIDPRRLEIIFNTGKIIGLVPLRRIMADKHIRSFYLNHSKNP